MGKTARRFSIALLAPLLLVLVLAPGSPAPKATEQADGKLDEAWWERTEPFLRRVLNLPRSVTLELKDIQPAGAPEFRIILVEARQGEQVKPYLFYASADGTRILIDQFYDLTQDPFAANRERIQLQPAPSQGPSSAPVTIVEYSDYTCVYCQRFFLTIEQPMLERYGGQVRFVYKQFPLVGLRAWSEDAALAAACAFRQSNEAFWALHEQLFMQRERLKDKELFSQLAQKLPLDSEDFQTCFERREALAEVRRDIAEGESLGVQGTPTFFINGRPVHGLPSRERFLEIVEEELSLANSATKD
ncbi:MAG: DsbA family protein [Terriglobia bacterium]